MASGWTARLAPRMDVDLSYVAETLGLELTTRSGSLWARCPFHDERTPSFSLSDERGTYHCFGCGAKGGAATLAAHMRETSFEEARQWVQSLEEDPGRTRRRSLRRPPLQQQQQKGRMVPAPEMRSAVAACAEYYASELAYALEAGAARRYLWERGVSPRTAALFGLGYSPSSKRGSALAARVGDGASPEALVAAGVAFEGSLRDRFAGRLVLPIRDASGSALGFGSRSLPQQQQQQQQQQQERGFFKKKNPTTDKDDPLPPFSRKYVNSPTTDIFSKGSLLYGLDVAASAVRSRDEAVVVEGYFDVLALHDIGITNVVGSLGVALGPKQIEQAARFCDSRRVVLLLDADDAGQKALDKLVTAVLPDLVEDAGIDVRIAHLPDGFKDAADYVNAVRNKNAHGQPEKQQGDLAAHFQTTVLDTAVSWSHRRASTLLGDVFNPGTSSSSSSSLDESGSSKNGRLIHSDSRNFIRKKKNTTVIEEM